MIIYIATYPRSGNTLTRNLIHHYFDIWTLSLYRESIYPDFNPTPDPSDQRFVLARNGAGEEYQLLRDGSLRFLTPKLRKQLAQSKQTYFIKTHDHPFMDYFRGEYIVQVVRHPGAVAWSYFKYLNDVRNIRVSLDAVIKGYVPFGSWRGYWKVWRLKQMALQSIFFTVRFEDLVSQETHLLNQIRQWTDLEFKQPPQSFPDFSYWHNVNPTFYRQGQDTKWVQQMTSKQLHMLVEYNREAMLEEGFLLEENSSPEVNTLYGSELISNLYRVAFDVRRRLTCLLRSN